MTIGKKSTSFFPILMVKMIALLGNYSHQGSWGLDKNHEFFHHWSILERFWFFLTQTFLLQIFKNCHAYYYEKKEAGCPKNGQDYGLFAKNLRILRKQWEVHGTCWHFLTTPKTLRNICNNWAKSYVTSYKILILCCLCILHVNYMEMLQGFHRPLSFPKQYILKLYLYCMIFNIIYKKWIQLNKHRLVLCVNKN